MQPRAELKTARLRLRPVEPQDEAAVVAALNDMGVTGWLSVVPFPYTPEDFQFFLTEIARPGETWAVLDDQGFAGIVGAGEELGYWFTPRTHGKGYATEAARAILAEQLACNPSDVVSGYFEGNARSANVLRKLGFVEVGRGPKACRAMGIDRPHVEMRLTRDAFVAALPAQVRTARMTYRNLWPVDLPALHRIVSHWDVVRQLASYPWPADLAFTRTRAWPYCGRGFVWGAFLSGRLVGTVAVTDDELGYMLSPEVWGQGLATEACRLAIDHAFAAGRDHLIAGVWADNAGSLALLAKLGFRVTDNDLTLNTARGETVAGHWLRLDRGDWRV
jgi:RimJ/RimL family protein N-acetyltransferase